jgi:hypothetical protein
MLFGALVLSSPGGPVRGRAASTTHPASGAAGHASDGPTNAPQGPNGAQAACADRSYSLYPNTWDGKLLWFFNSHSTPSGIDRSDAKGALRGAVKVITFAKNDCGIADGVDAKASFRDTTSTSVNISQDGSCKDGDGKSVVGFGTLPGDYLALTCWWVDRHGHTVEADIRFNKARFS